MNNFTLQEVQQIQPWTVPYEAGIDKASKEFVPHILGTHMVVHAMKTIGKIATIFEELDHSRNISIEGKSEIMTSDQLQTLKNQSADLVTAALRFANLYQFDLGDVLVERVNEKNQVDLMALIKATR